MKKDLSNLIDNQLKQSKKYKEAATFQIKPAIQQKRQQTSRTVISQYFDQYQQYFQLSQQSVSLFHNSQSKQVKELYKMMSSNGFVIVQQFSQKIRISNIFKSRSSEVVQLQVHLSFFKTKIIILNQHIESQTHNQLSPQSNGSFGQVYLADAFDQRFAIKCLHFDYTIQTFYNILKQYFFLLLFSALQIGPKVKKIYGFDLLVSQKCIQFSSQICKDKISNLNQTHLKESLLKIHRLKIVHRDIKSQNIMYSPSFQKNILIDFGACDVIQQQIGNKSKSHFIGTLGYCCEQMTRLVSKQQKFIDLYYNDVFGLTASLKQITYRSSLQHFFSSEIQLNQFPQFNFQSLKLLVKNLKLFLWKQQYQKFSFFAKQIIKYQQNISIFQKCILIFFFQLTPNIQRRNFFQKIFNYELLIDPKITSVCKSYGKKHSYYFLDNFQNQQFRSIIKFYSILEIQSRKSIYAAYYDVCMIKLHSQKEELKSILNNWPMNSKVNLQSYLLLLLDFISFTQNDYKNTIQQKLQVCDNYFKYKQHFFNKIEIYQPLICQGLKLIALTIKSLLLQFSDIIVCFQTKFKFYWKAIQNYSLLCENIDEDIIQSINFKQVQQFTIKQRIILFWRSYYEYQTSFFLQRYPNNERHCSPFLSTSTFNLTDLNISKQQKTIQQFDLYEIHDHLLKILVLDQIPFDQTTYDRIESIILQEKLFQNLNFTKNECKQFKKYIIYLSSLCCSYKGLQNSHKIIRIIQNLLKEMILPHNQNNRLPLFQNQLLIYYVNNQDFKKIKQLFQVFDNVIDCQQMSLKFYFQFRLMSAFHLNDYQTIDKISKVIQKFNIQKYQGRYKIFRAQLVFYGIQFYFQKQVQYKKTMTSYKEVLKIILRKGAQIIKGLTQDKKKLDSATQKFQQVQVYTCIMRYVHEFYKKYQKYLIFEHQQREFLEYFRIDKIFPIVKNLCQKYLRLPIMQSIYMKFLDAYYKNNIELCLDQFESLYKTNQVQNKLKLNRLSRYDIQVQYKKLFYQLKFNNWKKKQNFQNILFFYQKIKKYVNFSIFFKIQALFPILWGALQICNTPSQGRLQFIKQILQFVENSNSQIFINFYHKRMKHALICKNHKKCIKQKNCSNLNIIKLFHQHLQLGENQKNRKCYSLISFYCLYNQQVEQKFRKRFLKSIKQNIKYLNQPFKRVILQKNYYFLHKNNKRKAKWVINKSLKYVKDKQQKQEKISAIEKKLNKLKNISKNQLRAYLKKLRSLCFLNQK